MKQLEILPKPDIVNEFSRETANMRFGSMSYLCRSDVLYYLDMFPILVVCPTGCDGCDIHGCYDCEEGWTHVGNACKRT